MNKSPAHDASRWVIDFKDWSELRARGYAKAFERVERDVKPERLLNNNEKVRKDWWQYKRIAPDMRRAIEGADRTIVIALVSKVVMPVLVPTGQVFSHMLGIFASSETGLLAFLSSAPITGGPSIAPPL